MATTTGLHNVGDGNGATTTNTGGWGETLDNDSYQVFRGIDVGKSSHYAVALNRDGERLTGNEMHQDEAALRRLFTELSRHGKLLVIVDQPRNIGALPVAVARDCDIDVAYLPGLRMRRIADLHPGNGKTDTKDAFIIADAARTLPDKLCRSGRATTS